MTTPTESSPQFENKPVILLHLTVDPTDGIGPKMLWCSPHVYVPDYAGAYPNIPRVICPACARAHLR